MNFFIDTHCHLNFEDFDPDIDQVVEEAFSAGIQQIVIPAVDVHSSKKAIKLAEQHSGLFAAIGLHPNYVDQWDPAILQELASLAHHPKVVAIGEIGLDLYHKRASLEKQVEALIPQLALAKSVNKPIILHSRNAVKPLIETISTFGSITNIETNGVFHSFEGTIEEARSIIQLGYHLGVGGRATYQASEPLRLVFEVLGFENTILETDSPYLAPGAQKGERNRPAMITEIADYLANLFQISLEKLSDVTSRNAQTLFNLEVAA